MLENFDVKEILNCYNAEFFANELDAKPRKAHAIVYFHEADSTYTYNNEEISVSNDYILFLPKGKPYHICHRKSCKLTVINLHSFQAEEFAPFAIKVHSSLARIFWQVVRLFNAKRVCHEYLVKSAVYRILSSVQASAVTYMPSSKLDKITPALDFIRENYSNPELSLNDIVKTTNYGKRYFLNQFQRATGVTPIQFLISVRLDNAKRLLYSTETPIKDVAYLCGFKNEYYFSNAFKNKIGESPRDYRKSCRNV